MPTTHGRRRSSTAAAATRCSSSSWPRWRRRAAPRRAARARCGRSSPRGSTSCPASQRAIVDNAAVLGTADSIAALVRFAEAMGQEFRQRDLDELAADGLLDVDGQLVALPQRRRARGRLPDPHEAGAGPAPRRRRGAVLAEQAAPRSTTSPTTRPRPPSCSPSSARSTASARSITGHAVHALHRGGHGRRSRPAARSTPSAHASRALDLHRADPQDERELLLVRAERRARAAQVRRGRRPTPRRCSRCALAAGDRVDEGEARRRLGTVAQMQGDLATARRELDAARRAVPRASSDPQRLAERAAGARLRRGVRRLARRRPRPTSTRRWRSTTSIDDERGHAWTHQNLAWVAFQAGDFARRRGAARRGPGALRGARRPRSA